MKALKADIRLTLIRGTSHLKFYDNLVRIADISLKLSAIYFLIHYFCHVTGKSQLYPSIDKSRIFAVYKALKLCDINTYLIKTMRRTLLRSLHDKGFKLHLDQDPMTGFKTLELAFSQGFRMKRVSFTKDIYFVKDKGLYKNRYTYARLDGLKVLQTVVLDENQPLDGLPCFCLFYGTLEGLRGQGNTISFIEKILEQFKQDLPWVYKEFYIESLIEIDNKASLAISEKLFGELNNEGVDEKTGIPTRIWQIKITKL